MSRPLRIAYPNAWYHIMNRGLAHNPIFIDDSHRQIFLDLLHEIHHRYQVEIHAYCLMDNHYHLLLRTPLGNISRIMRHLDGIYTQRFNRSVKRDGPLFRGRYKSILIEADAYLLRLSRYIHLNPIKAKLVKKSEEFRWSSYQAFLSGTSPYWLNTGYTLSFFGNYAQRKKYKAFIEEGVDTEINRFYKNLKNLPILGTDAFTKTVTEVYLQERHKINDIPEHKRLFTRKLINIDNIIRCVAEFYRIDRLNVQVVKRKNGNSPRAIAMYLSHTIGQHSFSQISPYFSNITSAGVSIACQRLREKIKNHTQLKLDVGELEEIIMKLSTVET